MSVAGLLEAATALVLLRQESHQISRCLHGLQHQGVCRKGKPRSREEEKALVWLYPPSRPRLCQPNPRVSQQVFESPRSKDGGGGVLGGRRLEREYGARGSLWQDGAVVTQEVWEQESSALPPGSAVY